MPSATVESFELDHTIVAAPYVREAVVKQVGTDGIVTKYDVRFTQPNKEFLKPAEIHTLEHLLALNLRGVLPEDANFDIIDLSPMGCQTGFYFIVSGRPDIVDVIHLLRNAAKVGIEADEVPAANEIQCGQAALQDLEGAKKWLEYWISQSDETLKQVFA